MTNTILIVDDDPFYQHLLKTIVTELGFTAETCSDGDAAIAYMKTHRTSVVAALLDLYMPEIDGVSVLGHLHANYPDVPVIIITGSDDADDERVSASIGIAGYLKKPLALDTIHATLRALLPQR